MRRKRIGYCKVNDIVDEFVQQLKNKMRYRNDTFSDERPVFDEEYVDNIINIVANEIKERYK